MRRFIAIPGQASALALVLVALVGCKNEETPVQAPPPPVTVAKPVQKEVIDYDYYEGRVAAVETVEVRARVRGHIVKVNFSDGQMVKKGDLLFEIDPRTYQATYDKCVGQVKTAEAQFKLAIAELARAKEISKTPGAISQAEIDKRVAQQAEADATVLTRKAELESAQADLDYTKVTAEIGGKISRPLVTVGNLVNAGGGETLLTTIVSVNPMYVYFDVDERAWLRYRRAAAQKAGVKDKADTPKEKTGTKDEGKGDDSAEGIKRLKIPFAVALEGDEGHPREGLVDFVENKVNASTGTIQVRGILNNDERLFDSGMRARVRVPVSDKHKVLLVSERAVGSDQGRKFVYVVNDQNIAQRRDIKSGRLIDGMLVIEDGLKPDDWVVVNGIQRVRDGLKVEPRRTNP